MGIADWVTVYVRGMNSEAETPQAAARSRLGPMGSTLAPPVNTPWAFPVAFVFFPPVEPLGVACGFLCWAGRWAGEGAAGPPGWTMHLVLRPSGAVSGEGGSSGAGMDPKISLGRKRRVEIWVLGAKWIFSFLHET